MAKNTFRAKEEKGKATKRISSGSSLFSFIEKKLDITGLIGYGIPVKLVPPFLYAATLALIYIWSNHKAENTIREINRVQQEVEDLRADVTTLEADYMFSSKQSEVAKKMQALGVYEIDEPPMKIKVKK
ncbi:hypothetical protein KIH41_09235 [Litoribacter ruber]|uniref:Cell division protein FtsL n=1 Tax=Litoribacter ruber TaxID=702568 RepID=A0AAP2CHK5_9BACT|nr:MULTISPECIES: FtsL-like putative cell division protein [Litoribacter]MBS9523945.1 hypothetical protein [Litoribacter alkaliphilus]MBT0811460.1 hypothetical protein [Litoribacter ruber]